MNELNLEELAAFVRKTMPSPNEISRLEKNEPAGVITFTWHNTRLVVQPSLQVFELKGQQLFITGSSHLVQTILAGENVRGEKMEAVLTTLDEASDFLRAGKNDTGLALLKTVKSVLTKLSGARAPAPQTKK